MPTLRSTIRILLATSAALTLAHFTYAQAPTSAEPAASNAESSYSLGLSFASQWREGGLEGNISTEEMIRGIRAGLAGTAMTADDKQRASNLLHDAYQSWAKRNESAAEQFLAGNAKQANIKTTASGLQYQILKTGTPGSAAPSPGDHVTVQYRGKLLNGYEFDSTYARGKPAVIRPNDVIAGWREALAMMPAGSQWRLFIPPSLAYALTPPPSIPPDSLLIFDIEVVSIEKAPAHAVAAPPPAAALSPKH
jgi:FKBP-type peptidyl-prolyl cis-trans isomerase